MSQLQVTKITTVDNTTPLILATGNAGGGQIIVQSSNTDVFFNGNINFSSYVTGDGSGLFLPTSNVANAAFNTANAAYASANNVAPQVTPAFNTANVAFDTANAAFASANNVAPQVEPSFRTANAAFVHANAAYDAANNVGPQIAPTFNTANAAFAKANIASNTAIGAYNTANSSYDSANAAFNAANGKFSSSGGTISGAVEITADLTVHGNTRFIDQQTLSVGDPLIYLAANNYTSDVVDIGFVANYVNSTSANVHTGLYRSSGTKEYYLFYGYDKEPYNNYIDPTGNNIQQAVLNSTLRTSNIILGGANAINWITSAYAQANAGGANVGQTAPTGVSSGKLWWNSDLGKLYVYYTDPANTSSWIETSPSAASIEGAIITGYINPVYNTVNAAYGYANTFGGVYDVANAAFAAANNITPQIAPSYNTANSAYNTANAAFGKANTALQNTSGVSFNGNFYVPSGNVGIGTSSPSYSLDLNDRTDGIRIPSGTTAQRPAGANGVIRHNTTTGYIEYYDSSTSQWVGIGQFYAAGGTETTYTSGGTTYKVHTYTSSGTFTVNAGTKNVKLLVVAGGGAGGYDVGGGGGAGGYIYQASVSVAPGAYSIVVGSGGARPTGTGGSAASGSNSSGLGYTATGGGGGGNYSGGNGASGGSGGGGAGYGASTSGGSGTAGQGYAGGNGLSAYGNQATGGGGGGAGGAGSNSIDAGSSRVGLAPGGVGVSNSITGSPVTYAKGGDGGGDLGPDAVDASPNTGNGGVGAGQYGSLGNSGGAGGSGIVIISYTA